MVTFQHQSIMETCMNAQSDTSMESHKAASPKPKFPNTRRKGRLGSARSYFKSGEDG